MTEMCFRPADYRLTTAEILYQLPDFPNLLQSFVWQNLDMVPHFPALHRFLEFWQQQIEGKLHSVRVASVGIICPRELRYANVELRLH